MNQRAGKIEQLMKELGIQGFDLISEIDSKDQKIEQ